MSADLKLGDLLKDRVSRPGNSTPSQLPHNLIRRGDGPTIRPVKQERGHRGIAAALIIVVVAVTLSLVPDLRNGVGQLITKREQSHSSISSAEVGAKETTLRQEITPSGREKSAFSKPIQELMDYVQCLRKGRCAFKPTVSGEEAAKQFGYSRLFASAYEEMILRVRKRQSGKQRLGIDDVVTDFEAIVQEEQAVDKLMGRKNRLAASIAYLRALQNGDVIFPAPQAMAPAPPVLLAQIISAYPDVKLELNDPTFALVYRETRQFASVRMKASNEIWVSEITGQFRRIILGVQTSNDARNAACDKGRKIASLVVFAEVCTRLRLNHVARKVLGDVKRHRIGNSCKEKAMTDLRARFREMSRRALKRHCERFYWDARMGKSNALEIIL